MRPKDLKFPFNWDSREPLLLNGVLYVPKHYDLHHIFPKESFWETFSSYKNIAVEYCSGNGTWVAEKAKEDPSVLWIAVEKRFDRIQKIWAKKENFDIENLLIVCGDVFLFTKYYLLSDLVDQIFVNFPDPWPKDRHAKHRIIQEPLVREMLRVTKSRGSVVLVTDDEPYSSQMIFEMLKEGAWSSCFPEPDYYKTEWPSYGTSYFDSLWKNQGKVVRYMKFINEKEERVCYECK